METFFTIYEHAFSAFGAIVKMFYLHKPKIYAELKVDRKDFFIAPDYQPSWTFIVVEEKEYISSFSNPRLMKKILIRVDLFSLCYRLKIILYNKFIFRMRLSEGLKTKIINSVSAK